MWTPGTLLTINRWWSSGEQPIFGIVVWVKETGYGTLGKKWDAMLLVSTASKRPLVHIPNAWKLDRYCTIHKDTNGNE